MLPPAQLFIKRHAVKYSCAEVRYIILTITFHLYIIYNYCAKMNLVLKGKIIKIYTHWFHNYEKHLHVKLCKIVK